MSTKPVKPAESTAALVPWKERMAAVVAQAAGMEAPKGGFLSFKGGRMSYDDTPIPGDKMEIIILDHVLENTWYSEPYNALKPATPDCYALGRDESELAPHAESDDPQNDFCSTCPKNEWGSDPNGGRGKACKNTRRIAVIAADVLKADEPAEAIRKASAVMCKLPVTSIKLFSKTINQIVKVLGVAPFAVVVELSVTPHPSNQFQVNWKILHAIENSDMLEALYTKHIGMKDQMFQPYPKLEDEAPKTSGKY